MFCWETDSHKTCDHQLFLTTMDNCEGTLNLLFDDHINFDRNIRLVFLDSKEGSYETYHFSMLKSRICQLDNSPEFIQKYNDRYKIIKHKYIIMANYCRTEMNKIDYPYYIRTFNIYLLAYVTIMILLTIV